MESKSPDEQFQEQGGLAESLPLRFREIPLGFPDRQTDRLIGVLLETDANRLFLLDKLNETIKGGKHALVVHTDVDGLKYWNDTHGRKLGDRAIIHSVCAVAEAIDECSPKDEQTEIVIFRADSAADEGWFFILGLTKEETVKLRDELREKIASQPPAHFPNIEKGVSFSWGISSSADESLIEFTAQTQRYLKEGRMQRPYDLFKTLQANAVAETTQLKLKRTSETVDEIKRQPDLAAFTGAVIAELGGLRIDPKTLELLIKETTRRAREENE